MNKYRVVYGYCHPHAMLTHLTRTKICNSFDEAKNFINNLPKISFRIGDKDCKCSNFSGLGKEPSNLYAKIRMVNSGEKEYLLDAVFQMVCWLKENGKI